MELRTCNLYPVGMISHPFQGPNLGFLLRLKVRGDIVNAYMSQLLTSISNLVFFAQDRNTKDLPFLRRREYPESFSGLGYLVFRLQVTGFSN